MGPSDLLPIRFTGNNLNLLLLERVVKPPICSQLVRSTSDNLNLQLVSEVKSSLVGLRPLPPESDSPDSVRIQLNSHTPSC